MTANASLAAEDLALKRGGMTVLSEVSAALTPGQITAIVGPNGAGKSSLLLALAGLLEPAQGAVSLDQQSLSSLTPQYRAQAIGYLPQDADIAWDVSAEALIALGRMPHRDKAQEPVDAAISALDLEAYRHRPVSQLSGGEKARVLLARVLAGEPSWILADEPLAALDLAHQQSLLAHLRASASQGAGVVIVVHDLAIAMNHADRVLVLNGGKSISFAAPDEALSPEIIAKVWDVSTDWMGEPGRRALTVLDQG